MAFVWSMSNNLSIYLSYLSSLFLICFYTNIPKNISTKYMHTAYISFHPLLPPSLEPLQGSLAPLAFGSCTPFSTTWTSLGYRDIQQPGGHHAVASGIHDLTGHMETMGRCGFWKGQKYGMKLGFCNKSFIQVWMKKLWDEILVSNTMWLGMFVPYLWKLGIFRIFSSTPLFLFANILGLRACATYLSPLIFAWFFGMDQNSCLFLCWIILQHATKFGFPTANPSVKVAQNVKLKAQFFLKLVSSYWLRGKCNLLSKSYAKFSSDFPTSTFLRFDLRSPKITWNNFVCFFATFWGC